MKRYILQLFFLGIISISNAQVPFVAGQQAPDFTVADFHGNTHHLYDYCSQGNYILIDFFGYWCETCLATSHNIDDFYHKYGCNQSNIIVLGNESDPNGTLSKLLQFIAHSGGNSNDTYPQWCGTQGGSAIADLYVIQAYPTVMLIGPDSTFISVKVWPLTSVTAIEDAFPAGVLTPMPCSNDIDEAELRPACEIYPNPAHDKIMIELPVEMSGTVSVQIIDMLGNIVIQQVRTINPVSGVFEVPMQQITAGEYLVRVFLNQKAEISRKVIKF